ncbi:DUF1203 domain-containing protein [Aureimonas sp. D3]|uniref:DUF1203 domain-containing protein n=1 Tax=Aureimonas sp. D3 TaxID=1638164 RepID=UPI0007849376|nr:DUF1203 domain-containing protein [Aureimonas sp. D3]
MTYRITGLSPDPFRHLYGLDEADLGIHGAIRMRVDESPGFPDRITLREIPVGENALLLNHVSLDARSPYRATHAIFVWEGATDRYDEVGRVPEVLRRRLLSLRAFDAAGMMQVADVVEGTEIESVVERMFANAAVHTIHAHNAKQGCFAARIHRT